jgi:hypothetical protein
MKAENPHQSPLHEEMNEEETLTDFFDDDSRIFVKFCEWDENKIAPSCGNSHVKFESHGENQKSVQNIKSKYNFRSLIPKWISSKITISIVSTLILIMLTSHHHKLTQYFSK